MSEEPISSGADSDDRPGGGGYVTKRDLRNALIGVIVLIIALIPFYRFYRGEMEFTSCRQNLLALSKAINVYSVDNDERLPVAFARDAQGIPYLENGKPFTWASAVKGFMNAKKKTFCPAAQPGDECASVSPIDGEHTLSSTYGMYGAIETLQINAFVDKSQTILVAETISGGKRGSFNPHPLMDGNDGFLIGFDSGNFRHPDVFRGAKNVTRLAYGDWKTDKGVNPDAVLNHRKGLIAITLEGNALVLGPESAELKRDLQGQIGAPWAVPSTAADKFEPNR